MAVIPSSLAVTFQSEITRTYDPVKRQIAFEATIEFTVLVSDPQNDTVASVENSGVFPRAGINTHPDSPSLECVKSTVTYDSPVQRRCVAQYSTRPIQEATEQGDEPVQGWSFSIGGVESQEPFDRDADGKPIMTFTGERFDPPLMMDVSDVVLTFGTTNRAFNPFTLAQYQNALNSDTFLGCPPGTCKMGVPTGSQNKDSDGNTTMNVSVSITIRFAAPGSTDYKAWWRRVLAEGFYVKSALGLRVRAVDELGEPTVNPVLHNKTTGVEITNQTLAQFYEFQPPNTKYLSFSSFFSSL